MNSCAIDHIKLRAFFGSLSRKVLIHIAVLLHPILHESRKEGTNQTCYANERACFHYARVFLFVLEQDLPASLSAVSPCI